MIAGGTLATGDRGEIVCGDRAVAVLAQVSKGGLECGPRLVVEVEDRDQRSDRTAEHEARQAPADEIDDAAQRATLLAEWNTHALSPSIALQRLRRKTITVVNTVSLKRTTMCGVWYGLRYRSMAE